MVLFPNQSLQKSDFLFLIDDNLEYISNTDSLDWTSENRFAFGNDI